MVVPDQAPAPGRYFLPERFRDFHGARVPIPEADPDVRARTDDPVLGPYDPIQAVFEAQRCLYCHEPACVTACPIGQDCREYVLEVSRGNFDRARDVILRDNPLASTLCQVCYHYCEQACVYAATGEPIAIRHLKRAALDFGGEPVPFARGPPTGRSVGIVGGGPAGLMAAWWLTQRGHTVTVYEASGMLGGLATMTIPPYRLPREAFDEDMERMQDLGIDVRFHARLGRDVALDDLRRRHDAVLVAIGTHAPNALKVPGGELPGVVQALDFLKSLPPNGGLPAHAIVVGGGDVAMDCARMALRRGARDVKIVYRRSREEMPASDEEIRETEDEGVEFQYLTSPVRAWGNGRVERLECQRMTLGEPDASGRRKPVPVPGATISFPAGLVIFATGQKADLGGLGLESLDVAADGEGVIAGVDGGVATLQADVFVAGGTSVAAAMKAGREAAQRMDAYLASRPNRGSILAPSESGG